MAWKFLKSTKPKEVSKPATATVSKPAFPVNELKTWLKGRKGWNHNDWLALLTDIRSKGYSSITDTQEGRDSIGKFLEANKSQ